MQLPCRRTLLWQETGALIMMVPDHSVESAPLRGNASSKNWVGSAVVKAGLDCPPYGALQGRSLPIYKHRRGRRCKFQTTPLSMLVFCHGRIVAAIHCTSSADALCLLWQEQHVINNDNILHGLHTRPA